MPLNEMLGNQTETQLWALKMTLIGFQCDDKPIQSKKKKKVLHLKKQQQNTLQRLISVLVVLF